MNLPNKLTVFRVLLIPVFVYFMLYSTASNALLYACILFLVASFTDFLDGYIARRANLVTDFGKLMDPLADKLLVASALILMAAQGYAPVVAVIIIISREFLVTSIRTLAATSGRVIAADKWGKCKTVLQMTWIVYSLLYHWAASRMQLAHPVHVAGAVQTGFWWLEYALMLATTAVTVISGINYMVKNKDLFLNNM